MVILCILSKSYLDFISPKHQDPILSLPEICLKTTTRNKQPNLTSEQSRLRSSLPPSNLVTTRNLSVPIEASKKY